MKTVIAGGRDYKLTKEDYARLKQLSISEVVSGGCRGVDSDAEAWAKSNGLPIRVFEADWQKHKRAAGPIRNRQMAEYADAVVLFPGGRGTDSMYREAVKANCKLFDFRETK